MRQPRTVVMKALASTNWMSSGIDRKISSTKVIGANHQGPT